MQKPQARHQSEKLFTFQGFDEAWLRLHLSEASGLRFRFAAGDHGLGV